ncbi:MAG TPA: hypothetical protein VGR29_02285 [Thermomicrobiales bacterium]|nr:hypothetical protein [Thermomicrobiales bacterium]
MAIPTTVLLVWNQVLSSLHVLRDRTAQACALTSLIVTLIAIATVPDIVPGFWDWFFLLLIGALSMVAIITFVASRQASVAPADRQHRVTAAFTIGVIALVLNIFFELSSTILLGIGMVMLARQAVRVRPGTFPWLLCATLVILIPWWVWSALDAWHPGLFLLIPLAALAYLTGSHIREAYATTDDAPRPLSTRGHRLGAWMGMLLGGILIVIGGLIGSSSYGWISLGGIAMAVAVAVEAGISRPEDQPGKYSATICDGAFVIGGLCWLISIT